MCKKNDDKYIKNQWQEETSKFLLMTKFLLLATIICISEEQKDAEALTRETGRKEKTKGFNFF